ncbi:MAG: GGDEF domain-containing response regulator [Rhodospirillaceae bacterium]
MLDTHRKILIVDDMLPNALIAAATLEQLGHVTCKTVESGTDALDLAREWEPDLLVTDYLMPNMNGLELIGKIRAQRPKELLPVILITAVNDRTLLYMALEGRAIDVVRKPFDELELLARAGNLLQMRADRLALIEANRRLEQLATTDALTGVRNRRSFMDMGTREISRCRRNGSPFCLLMFDIDHFKVVNDTHGHATGDIALVTFTRLVQETLREADQLARLGGEEFIAILPDTALPGALEVAERLRQTLSETEITAEDGTLFRVTVSIGAVCYEGKTGIALDQLMGKADKALYSAKTSGRNRVISG